ncbi:MAG: hypothetical protein ACD_39C00744G0002 [uncultured bacterium]|nr:MAG: hypothetical protein ACD_39C00744G0002 [uncultured bacterium]
MGCPKPISKGPDTGKEVWLLYGLVQEIMASSSGIVPAFESRAFTRVRPSTVTGT